MTAWTPIETTGAPILVAGNRILWRLVWHASLRCVRALWRRLTEPPTSFIGIDRRRARLVTSLLVVLIALGTTSASIQLAVVPGFAPTFAIVMTAVMVLVIAWALVCTGRYVLGAAIVAVLPAIASLIAAATNPHDPLALAFVSLGVVLASFLVSVRIAALIGALAVGAIVVLAFVQPALDGSTIIAAAFFNVIATALVLVAARHRDAVEADRLAEQARVHEQLLRSDRLASLGMLAASVAHETRNPLMYVGANVELLERHVTDSESKRFLADARTGLDRIGALVRGLTSFARGSDPTDTPADVRAALESAITIADVQIRHRARLVRAYADVPPARADLAHLEQVFVNLLINAAQAIPDGSPDRHEIRIGLELVGDTVEVSVGDTGAGIPTDQLQSIFEPFVSSKPRTEGTGLGLAICRDIVMSFGGRIDVTSQLGTGTTFRVAIPAMRD